MLTYKRAEVAKQTTGLKPKEGTRSVERKGMQSIHMG